ncbi:MAG: hypothetical protein R3345_01980 [Fulvivirga sp.]|nr:hypothetical protein [Fulvivirga sp.]
MRPLLCADARFVSSFNERNLFPTFVVQIIVMQELLIVILFLGALTYLGILLYKSFKGDAGCSTNCGCDSPVHDYKKKLEKKTH